VATVSGTTFTGATKHSAGLSGSLTNLTDGTSYLVAGSNVTITTGSNGAVTIAASSASGTVTGTGTASYLARFTATSTIGNSIVQDDGTRVGVGTTGTSTRMSVLGTSTGTDTTLLVKHNVADGSNLPVLDVQNSAGTSLLFISGSGGVGISTNNPQGAQFYVSSSLTGNPASAFIIGGQVLGVSLNTYKGQTQIFQLANGTTEVMRLNSAANVGIGTGTYTARLFVSGSSTATTPTMVVKEGVVSPTGGAGTFDVQNSAGTSLLFVSGSGGVGIGTNSFTGRLYVSGSSSGTVTTLLARHGVAAGAALPVLDVQNSAGTSLLFVSGSGNVGIGTSSPAYTLEVAGTFAATTKSFVIPHPTREGWKLRYGSLEGPENGVYARGKSTSTTIDLPEYWTALVDAGSITVHITPIGKWQSLFVEKVENNQVKIGMGMSMRLLGIKPEFFYVVTAARKDATFEVEFAQEGVS
jgi:hypothetical protein